MKYDDWFNIILTTIILLVLFGVLFMGGCTGNKCTNPDPITKTRTVYETVTKTNWTAAFSIPIIALGVVVVFLGMAKLGFAFALFGGITLFLNLATARFGTWMAVLGLVGVTGAVVAGILYNTRALKEVIRGAEIIRTSGTADEQKSLTKILKGEQTNLTRNLVKRIKGKL